MRIYPHASLLFLLVEFLFFLIRYGAPAGNLACGTFDTLGNAFVISRNVNYITPKGLAKKLVKKTGEAVVIDYKRDLRKPESHYINAGALYPDLRALKD